jgi:hypothetical protein
MRRRIRRVVEVAAPAGQLWDYVTDWPTQGEWIPFTRVERVDRADGLGGRLRAWTGVGPLGFWDPMTITRWHRDEDGGGVCEVLHTGSVVRGEGEFAVVATSPLSSRFVWSEVLDLPAGRVGAVGWLLVRPVTERMLDRALHRLRRTAEERARSRAA